MRDAGDYGSEERDEIILYPGAGCKDFFGREWRAGHTGGHIRYAGDAEHADIAVTCRDNFRHSRHADEIGAESAERMDFGGRFVIGPG